ncbi:MAG TPA: class I adenylate-forming enzyme family protein [Vicinamibacterales bacterium]|nr:class I adenylate-forming enzyme family protein [Vicinamibacterales bacterium]
MSTVLARFADICRDDPARPLIHLPSVDRRITASEIWNAHLEYADRLAQAGVSAGRLVISAAGNTPSFVTLLLACRALDAAVLPLDAEAPPTDIEALAARFGAAAVVTRNVVHAVERRPQCYAGLAMLKLTSGSSGSPKATRTTEAQLVADCSHIVEAMDIRSDDVQIAAIPLSHSYGLGNLLLPLLLQGTACVLRESFVPQLLADDARRSGARVFPGVPFMFEYFVDNPPADGWPPRLQRLISAGAPLAPATVRAFRDRFGIKIHSFYGSSETGGIAFDSDDDVGDSGAVGHPLPGVAVTIRNSRVHVRSDAVSSGYVDGPGDGFVDGGFMTADCGEWDAQGRLRLRGRVSSFVNVAGRKVQPGEVEAVLRTMPGVADARVVAAPDPRRGQQIVACIVVATAGAPAITTLSVRRYCAARLAPYKIPRAIVFIDRIPLTARGKTDRDALDAAVRARLRE